MNVELNELRAYAESIIAAPRAAGSGGGGVIVEASVILGLLGRIAELEKALDRVTHAVYELRRDRGDETWDTVVRQEVLDAIVAARSSSKVETGVEK